MEENKLKTVEQPRYRVVLVGLSSPVLKADSADEESMDELAALVETAGAVSVATVLQNLPSPNPRSFIGEGKVAEIKELIGSTEATMAIFDNDLSPSQMRVLTEDLGVQVLDRSGLILDIFAQRAKTKEGRLQVELAQYQYLLPRLIGMWTHLERQAGTSGKGPIGSKGPGETQLETDRRHIHRKIDKLKEDLDEVRRVRGTQRERRMKNEIPVVAIVGYTNAGKSTLLNLIPRFYDVSEGSVTIDGVDVRDMSQAQLHDQLGYVPQKGVLFSGTIDSNLKFGGDHITDADVRRAAEIAQAAEFISDKPEGYNAPIAQGGSNVSGGQKQRLSIARAIAKHPQIYLFDDSFSALDYKTDVALRRALKAQTDNATVLIVAQRISTVLHANQILVLDEGRLVGKGTHAQLMASCPEYQEIARSQLSQKELDLKSLNTEKEGE